MNTKLCVLPKTLALIIALLIMNVSFISSLHNSSAKALNNEDIRPVLGDFWTYERTDHEKGYVYNYNLSVIGENTTIVENQEIPVLVLEGYGKIVIWPTDVKHISENSIYIKKLISKETLEVIKYTQYIELEYYDDGQYKSAYTHENNTYYFLKYSRPSNITIGTSWTKETIRTRDLEFKTGDSGPQRDIQQMKFNSTLTCDKIHELVFTSGRFDTFMVSEKQWLGAGLNETIEYFYSDKANGYVHKIHKNSVGKTIETETLKEYGNINKSANGQPQNGDGGDEGTSQWYDIDFQDRNVQIIIGAAFLIIALILIGNVGFRKKGKSSDKK